MASRTAFLVKAGVTASGVEAHGTLGGACHGQHRQASFPPMQMMLERNTLSLPHAGTFGRMESNTTALVKILDSLEKQEHMVKGMLEDRKRQLKGKGRAQPSLEQLTASTAQVEHHATRIMPSQLHPWQVIPAASPPLTPNGLSGLHALPLA